MQNPSFNHLRFGIAQMLTIVLLLGLVLSLSAFTNVGTQSAKQTHQAIPRVTCRSGSVCVAPGLYHFSSCTSVGWSYPTGSIAYVPSHGSVACNYANWNGSSYTGSRTCAVRVYVPNGYATATISYGIFGTNGSLLGLTQINQANVSGYQPLTNGLTDIGYVHISDNDGQTGNDIGVDTTSGSLEFTCH